MSVENFTTMVWIARRSRGGVSITDMSRMPDSPIWSVRGIGVADSVRQSTLVLSCFSFSLAATPKRCSSSTISRPRSRKTTSFERMRWVPISTSTPPAVVRASTALISFGVRKREIISTATGNGAKRLRNVFQCWNASTVVGASTATCLPSSTARIAARIATSVLP